LSSPDGVTNNFRMAVIVSPTVVIEKIAFEFPIHFPILLGGDVLGVMEFFSFTI